MPKSLKIIQLKKQQISFYPTIYITSNIRSLIIIFQLNILSFFLPDFSSATQRHPQLHPLQVVVYTVNKILLFLRVIYVSELELHLANLREEAYI